VSMVGWFGELLRDLEHLSLMGNHYWLLLGYP
jgi:hypothetical protein